MEGQEFAHCEGKEVGFFVLEKKSSKLSKLNEVKDLEENSKSKRISVIKS